MCMSDRDSRLIAEAYLSINTEASVDPTPLLPLAMAAIYLTSKGIEKIKSMMSPYKQEVASVLKDRETAQAVKQFLLHRNVETKQFMTKKLLQQGALKGDTDGEKVFGVIQVLSKMSPEDIKE